MDITASAFQRQKNIAPNGAPPQGVPHFHLTSSQEPPLLPEPRVEVRSTATFAGTRSYGLSRPFRLKPSQVDRLLAAAERMEA